MAFCRMAASLHWMGMHLSTHVMPQMPFRYFFRAFLGLMGMLAQPPTGWIAFWLVIHFLLVISEFRCCCIQCFSLVMLAKQRIQDLVMTIVSRLQFATPPQCMEKLNSLLASMLTLFAHPKHLPPVLSKKSHQENFPNLVSRAFGVSRWPLRN